MSVTFGVVAAAKFGQRVCITGNAAIFDDWKIFIPLTTSPAAYPEWNVTIEFEEHEINLEYKYAIESDDGSRVWEPLPQNRQLALNGVPMTVNDGMYGDAYSATRKSRIKRPLGADSENDDDEALPHRPSSSPLRRHSSAPSSPEGSASAISLFNFESGDWELESNIKTVLLLLYVLPVRLVNRKTWTFEYQPTPMVQHLNEYASKAGGRAICVGTIGNVEVPVADQPKVRAKLKELGCIPVFVWEHAVKHYTFCKLVLWPAIHSVYVDTFAPHQTVDLWQAYSAVNAAFASEVNAFMAENDPDSAVWIHGYQLLEVAAFIRKANANVRIGLTVHSPFPPSEQIRGLTFGKAILHGMLSCSLIGFVLFDHARHFLSSCRRTMGIDFQSQPGGTLCVEYLDRIVNVRVSHVTVEPDLFQNLVVVKPSGPSSPKELPIKQSASAGAGAGWSLTVSENPLTPVELNAFYTSIMSKIPTHNGVLPRIVLGIDAMDYLAGVPLKLLAFEYLLADYVCWHGKVTLLQVSIPRAGVPWSAATEVHQKLVTECIERINSRFTAPDWKPVVHLEIAPPREVRQLLYQMTDVLCLMNIRDALNVVPCEYVCCKHTALQHAGPKEALGALVLSEFAGVSRSLSGALRVNPFDFGEVANALDTALNMSLADRTSRILKDYHHIDRHSVGNWVQSFMGDVLQSTHASRRVTLMSHMSRPSERVINPRQESLEEPGPRKLLREAYQRAQRRLIVVDFEGAMIPDSFTTTTRNNPDKTLIESLRKLLLDSRNMVYVMSGRRKELISKIIEDHDLQQVGLTAEHGFLYRHPRSASTEWRRLLASDNKAWMEVARPILLTYQQHTDNSNLSEKESTFTFNFRDVDPDLAALQTKELMRHLEHALADFDIRVSAGRTYLELMPRSCNRYKMTKQILSDAARAGFMYDFVFSVGGRHAEDTFEAVKWTGLQAQGGDVFTCTVRSFSAQRSIAKYFVTSRTPLATILAEMAEQSS